MDGLTSSIVTILVDDFSREEQKMHLAAPYLKQMEAMSNFSGSIPIIYL